MPTYELLNRLNYSHENRKVVTISTQILVTGEGSIGVADEMAGFLDQIVRVVYVRLVETIAILPFVEPIVTDNNLVK